MRIVIKLAQIVIILCLAIFSSRACAEDDITYTQEGRYVLATLESYGSIYAKATITKVPAVVLDTVLGIVWTCDNLQDYKPRWVKIDLAKNADKQLSSKRYTIRMPALQTNSNKIPAVVLDVKEGKVWTCSNLLYEGVSWVQTDLLKDVKEYLKGAGQPLAGQTVKY